MPTLSPIGSSDGTSIEPVAVHARISDRAPHDPRGVAALGVALSGRLANAALSLLGHA